MKCQDDSLVANNTRLRKGLLFGEGIVDEGSKSLLDAGLHNNVNLTLELGKRPFADIITLKICRVEGNDTDAKSNPSYQGMRKPAIDMEVETSSTIHSLKDRIGCELLNLEPGWSDWTLTTAHDFDGIIHKNGNDKSNNIVDVIARSPKHHFRLRKTDWLGEAGDILPEVNDKGELVTVDTIGLQVGSLVLFEHGDVPIKGMLRFNLFLWTLNPVAIIPSDTDKKKESSNVHDDVEIVEKPTVVEAIENQRKQYLVALGSVTFHESKALFDLQRKVFELLTQLKSDTTKLLDEGITILSNKCLIIYPDTSN